MSAESARVHRIPAKGHDGEKATLGWRLISCAGRRPDWLGVLVHVLDHILP